jgi:hypothetical protein
VMPAAFLLGLRWGATGLAYAWLVGFPLLPLFMFAQARDKLGIDARRLAAAVAPGLVSSAGMALAVFAFGHALSSFAPWQRLVLQAAFGAACYVGLLLVFSRAVLIEATGLIFRHRPAPATVAV